MSTSSIYTTESRIPFPALLGFAAFTKRLEQVIYFHLPIEVHFILHLQSNRDHAFISLNLLNHINNLAESTACTPQTGLYH
jgi:hypothetical protein